MRRPPHWARTLLRWAAPRGQADEVLGDFEEAHRLRSQRHGPIGARFLTAIDAFDMAAALVRTRAYASRINGGTGTVQDYKLGLRMLVKYPGLTIAGGLALAIAIGIGAIWYDFMGDLFRPRLAIPGGERIVEIEMRDTAGSEDERRVLYDFAVWRRDSRTIEELAAYRTTERNIILGHTTPVPVTVAETTAAMFRVVSVPPMHGRPLLEADQQPGAPPVVVLGYDVWKRWFDGRVDAIGQTVQLGRTPTTIVGVMPEGFAFPINHRMWLPLQLKTAPYAPLEGPPVRIFGRIAAGATQAEANVEFATFTDRIRAASPATHERLSPRVLAYGGESPGDRSFFEILLTHLPIILVMLVACANVGTLIYARTATRDAEISMRYALGATRARIITQLFVEALVLASVSAVVGLTLANWALKWALTAFYAAQATGMPFWMKPGLKPSTMLLGGLLTIVGAAMLGVLPALKATGKNAQSQLRNLGAGGSTLRFGKVWTTAMIGQVALTVICIPPALGISGEAWRDRVIRAKFPAGQYLALRLDVDRENTREGGEESAAQYAQRFERTYRELERRIAQQSDVVATTYADRLPGMGVAVRAAEVEAAPGAALVQVNNMWTAAVGPGFFQAFQAPIVAGRDFHDGDRVPNARQVIVNEAFARRFLSGASPVGRRVRFASSRSQPEPWFEIVGMVRDVGMTPTDLGEGPYIFRPATLTTARPVVMGIRVQGEPLSVATRVRAIATEVDPGLRLGEMNSLDNLVWRVDLPQMALAGVILSVVSLGMFLSAAGIFSLMSVSIARRTKEIGLRAALGATRGRLLTGIFARALVLIGSGIAIGNAVILLLVVLSDEIELAFVTDALLGTSAIMLTVGLLACIEPARRALRIHPTDALKQA